MKDVIYVAHPVSGNVKANCDKVLKWLKFLTAEDPSRIYIAPWVGEVLAHLDMGPIPEHFYERVLTDDEMVVRKLDGILLVGGKLSGGMARERAAARAAGKKVYDLLDCTDPSQVCAPEDDVADAIDDAREIL